MSEITINGLVPWMGSKRTMAPRIAGQLGKHGAYCEPFCGSMAVLFAKPAASMEVVSDLHGDLINLGHVIQHPSWGPWLYRRLRRIIGGANEEVFLEACARMDGRQSVDNFDAALLQGQAAAERAFDYFVVSWMGRNGLAGTEAAAGKFGGFAIRYTTGGGNQGVRFAGAVRSIPGFRRRLDKVTILHRDGFEVLERIEDARGTAIYLDPPYLGSTRGGRNGQGDPSKHARYLHDFTTGDHERLAELAIRFRKARVVISYYDSPELSRLFPGWTKINCPRPKHLAQQGRRNSQKDTAPEVLLVNGPTYAETPHSKEALFS